MVAVCAVVALFVKNRPYSPTTFILGLDEQAILTKCCKDLGVTLDIGGMGQSTLNDNVGGYVRETSVSIRSPDLGVFRSTVMPAFQSHVEQLLDDSACVIHGRSQGGNTDLKELHEFGFRYRRGVARGVIRAYSLEQPSGEIRLLILVDES